MSEFTGIWIPLVTPFARGAVDFAALRALVASYVETGIAGFVALGTTGEPASLDDDEQRAVLATILETAGDLRVVAGVAGNHAGALLARVCELNGLPLAGILVPAPYYVRPSQQGLHAHFTALADASTHPLMVYDIPYRTGVRIELDTLLSLAAHPNIVAIKDCAQSLDTTLALIRDGRLAVLAGDDLQFFNTICLGGHGAIAASAHLHPRAFVAVWEAARAGRLDIARDAFHRIVPLIQALGAEPNPGPVKAALSLSGRIDADLRAPMTRASDAMFERLRAVLDEASMPHEDADARAVRLEAQA
ncbi:4-hydroxy-tetrahydrodipicolinate synthase [Pararobbsia silviterrae]|uniref:4-hydroxy-tetrahydrodipicolinate synthase n=1 Tax=Pararobbsia silviterrae TaxID=1792498 RepID=A0A494XHU9_9BURK|nr:4-hydroxy-tetrahydrodipicolinate synthase [Pararobbsia silviterrae]RKP50327.1 4-hydroxy-tetrahydrodipicolinate synthase [Pararobbsia silviterrae]